MESPLHPVLRETIVRFFGEVDIDKATEIRIPRKHGDTPIERALQLGEGNFLFITSINASTLLGIKHAVGDTPKPNILIVVKGSPRMPKDDRIPPSWNVWKISEDQSTIDVAGHILNAGSVWGWNTDSTISLRGLEPPLVEVRKDLPSSSRGLLPILKYDDPIVVQLTARLGECVQLQVLPVVSGGDATTFLGAVRR